MALFQNLFSGKKGISSTTIKIIAVVTMLIDHIGAILITYYDNKIVNFILRLIGRIAFPLFAFCLAEGFAHTSSRKKYAIRLLVAAIISEPAYNLAFAQMNIDFLKQQNVLFTFFIAFCVLWVIENIKNKDGLKFKKPLILVRFQLIIIFILMVEWIALYQFQMKFWTNIKKNIGKGGEVYE